MAESDNVDRAQIVLHLVNRVGVEIHSPCRYRQCMQGWQKAK